MGPFKNMFEWKSASVGARVLLTISVLGIFGLSFGYLYYLVLDLRGTQSGPGTSGVGPRHLNLPLRVALLPAFVIIASIAWIWFDYFFQKPPKTGPISEQLNRCLRCGYSRDGLKAGTDCPECGLDSSGLVDPPRNPRSATANRVESLDQ